MLPVKSKVGLDRSKTGRAKGTPNKTTTLLKDAILKAAEGAGGKDGLVGYLTMVASTDVKAFCMLLGRVLPLQLSDGDGSVPTVVLFKTTYEDQARGIPPLPMYPR
jgi:hypothetical protein